jgi:hypothetical protein
MNNQRCTSDYDLFIFMSLACFMFQPADLTALEGVGHTLPVRSNILLRFIDTGDVHE